jgi:ferredoxin-thioredoxin reductase catalytic chain
LNDLLEGLKINEERFGYPVCPCRPGTGIYDQDRDIICPCDYRDPDVIDYGACYCSLYVDKKMFDAGKSSPIPERRPVEKSFPELATKQVEEKSSDSTAMEKKLWYCKQCGYTVFREEPPYICPICRAKKEFFAEIVINTQLKTN